MARFYYLSGFFLVLAYLTAATEGVEAYRKDKRRPKTKFLMWLSDIHADPYYGTEKQQCKLSKLNKTRENAVGIIGCDPPYELFASGAKAAASFASKLGTKRTIFTGDFVRHLQNKLPNPEKQVPEIINNITEKIIQNFRNVNIGTLGNDDSPENYYLNVTTNKEENPYLLEIAGVFGYNRVFNKRDIKQYSYGGATSKVVDNCFTMIMINTIIYSSFHSPDSTKDDDPFFQFRWLRNEIEKSIKKGLPVWIVGHIPPECLGTETFGYTQLWHAKYVKSYLSIVQDAELGPHVVFQIFGHTHADEIRVLPDAPEGSGPLLITSSMSPVYYNNPTFRSIEFNTRTGRPVGFQTYYTELASKEAGLKWKKGYSFPDIYDLNMTNAEVMTNSGIRKLQERLNLGLEDWQHYSTWYKTQYNNDLMQYGMNPVVETTLTEAQRDFARKRYTCATIVFETESEFHQCFNRTVYQRPLREHILSKLQLQMAMESKDFHQYYWLLHQQLDEELKFIN